MEKYMMRCLELAKKGLGTAYPNPLVGCVIVYDEKIIGEGWHYQAGNSHAEVIAIQNVEDKSLLKESTIYVSLEPCSHFGKTPPCADLIIEKGIKNVVIGSLDPNPKVSGKGINKLNEAGIDVTFGVLNEKCKKLNKRFFTFHIKKRPYIILKWAQNKDGYIAPINKKNKKPIWITNKQSRRFVHKWRAEEQAILVGTQTVLDDNPSLSTRDWYGSSPIRIVLDRSLKIPNNASVFNGKVKTIIITEKDVESNEQLIYETISYSEEIASQICDILYRHQIQSVIIEGGAKTLQTFIDNDLWDEARVFTGPVFFKEGIKAPLFEERIFLDLSIREAGEKTKEDILRIYKND